jgi:hypothetical protein
MSSQSPQLQDLKNCTIFNTGLGLGLLRSKKDQARLKAIQNAFRKNPTWYQSITSIEKYFNDVEFPPFNNKDKIKCYQDYLQNLKKSNSSSSITSTTRRSRSSSRSASEPTISSSDWTVDDVKIRFPSQRFTKQKDVTKPSDTMIQSSLQDLQFNVMNTTPVTIDMVTVTDKEILVTLKKGDIVFIYKNSNKQWSLDDRKLSYDLLVQCLPKQCLLILAWLPYLVPLPPQLLSGAPLTTILDHLILPSYIPIQKHHEKIKAIKKTCSSMIYPTDNHIPKILTQMTINPPLVVKSYNTHYNIQQQISDTYRHEPCISFPLSSSLDLAYNIGGFGAWKSNSSFQRWFWINDSVKNSDYINIIQNIENQDAIFMLLSILVTKQSSSSTILDQFQSIVEKISKRIESLQKLLQIIGKEFTRLKKLDQKLSQLSGGELVPFSKETLMSYLDPTTSDTSDTSETLKRRIYKAYVDARLKPMIRHSGVHFADKSFLEEMKDYILSFLHKKTKTSSTSAQQRYLQKIINTLSSSPQQNQLTVSPDLQQVVKKRRRIFSKRVVVPT